MSGDGNDRDQDGLCCAHLAVQVERADSPIDYSPQFREVSLELRRDPDGARIGQIMSFCPWCGAALPTSLRDVWFARLAELGIDDPWDDEEDEDPVPEPFLTDAWWRSDPTLS